MSLSSISCRQEAYSLRLPENLAGSGRGLVRRGAAIGTASAGPGVTFDGPATAGSGWLWGSCAVAASKRCWRSRIQASRAASGGGRGGVSARARIEAWMSTIWLYRGPRVVLSLSSTIVETLWWFSARSSSAAMSSGVRCSIAAMSKRTLRVLVILRYVTAHQECI